MEGGADRLLKAIRVGFQRDGAIAVLRTGSTEFKPAREFTRHISKLARYDDKWSV